MPLFFMAFATIGEPDEIAPPGLLIQEFRPQYNYVTNETELITTTIMHATFDGWSTISLKVINKLIDACRYIPLGPWRNENGQYVVELQEKT